MSKRLVLLAGCFLMVCHLGCMTKSQTKAVNDDYLILQQQLKVANAAKKQCRKKQDALQEKVTALRAENRVLNKRNKALEKKIKDKEAILAIHETVIRLFDDSKQTLQNSIREQIEAQKLER